MSEVVPEFSRTLPWGTVGRQEKREELEATQQERDALAKRFNILAIDALKANLRLRQEPGGAIRVRGRLTADVVQACVVTLEPVPQHVDEPVDLRFLPKDAEPDDDPDGPDEILTEGQALELGEAMAEQLALALDPYPRAPGAELDISFVQEEEAEPEEAPARPNPFAKLAALKDSKR
ncbi:YceD family protein [Roseomonas marmotae]|uniref:DUF177 domain-containing protein n=1 Tax=Roseomonas marmotae TaxID=2768161 RepID=A0ABS3KA47_9PROT|nr:DUF177 domain-containing protein [Roseomonas marmotae]MBO1074341.1 DUF177 domain-containing protein [Roseomonas marmotae]QTI78092.1 DUF177 domain-containing protein [Roseomonas marmotae]